MNLGELLLPTNLGLFTPVPPVFPFFVAAERIIGVQMWRNHKQDPQRGLGLWLLHPLLTIYHYETSALVDSPSTSKSGLLVPGCVLEKRERPIGKLHPHDAERLLRLLGSRTSSSGETPSGNGFAEHPAAFPSYTLMFVVALKRELCVQANAPSFQAWIL